MKPEHEQHPVEVFAGTSWQAETVKNMLEDNEIEAFIGEEEWGGSASWRSSSDNAGSIKVFVPRIDYESAKIVVERYYEDLEEE